MRAGAARLAGKPLNFEGMTLQIPADRHRCHYLKVKVNVLRRTNGQMAIHHGPRKLAEYDAKGKLLSERLPNVAA